MKINTNEAYTTRAENTNSAHQKCWLLPRIKIKRYMQSWWSLWKATSKNSNLLNHQFLASITEICQSTGLTITRAFGYLTTLIQRYRLHIRHEDAHECSTDKNFKDAAVLHGGTSGWRHLRKQQITDRISRNLAEIQQVIPPNKSTVSTRKITWY